jgi:uncharacterized membrane protein YgcG
MKRRLLGFALTLMLLGTIGFAPIVHADVNNFAIDNFAADYTLGQDDPQGTLTVREQLTVNFTDYNHGILRALPKHYNSMPLHIQVHGVSRDGASEPYTTSTENGNLVLKIGNANSTITGLHHYEINYKVTNVLRFVSGGAELDWNVNGTGWQQSFMHTSAQLHVPTSLAGKLTDDKCFTGATGSTSSDCLTSTSEGVTTFTTTRELSAGETLTFNDHIPAGYFSKPTLMDKLKDYGPELLVAIGAPLLALIVAGGAWYKHGRDAKGRGTIVPEYSPPDGLKAAEIDVLLNNKLGKNAISATIIDLAIRKYLRIQEGESKGVLGLGKHKTYSFVRLTAPADGNLLPHESSILSGLFMSGDTVETSSLKNSFYTTVSAVQKAVPKSLATRGYFARDPTSSGSVWHVIGIGAVFGSFFLLSVSVLVFIGVLVAGLITLLFATLMPSPTEKGALAKDAAAGLKLYLNTAEKDRIAMLQSPNAPYAPKTDEPTKTVDLFEKLLPYAMVLGVEKEWAKQFEDIYKTPPDWYGGNWSTFNAVYLTQSLSDSMGAMNNSFAAPSSSGSGGSAGGGGGGGGGGGW